MATIEALTEQVQTRLDTYISNMAPGRPTSEKEGASMQNLLWNTIQLVLKQESANFVTLMNLLLNRIHENRQGVFNPRYICRFLDKMMITAPERRNFERLLNLFITTSDPQTRLAALRQVSLTTSLQGLTSDAERERVVAYYNSL